MDARKPRIAAGILALVVLAGLGGRLLPPFWRNLGFQRALKDVAQQGVSGGMSDEAIRVHTINAAAGIGIPLRFEQVRIRRAANRLELEVLYVVPLDIPLYSVDLHFRPRVRVP
jgi:hypothetical protein